MLFAVEPVVADLPNDVWLFTVVICQENHHPTIIIAIIIKNFYACSPVVKCDLFKAFCCNMYCSHLWSDFKNDTLRRLIVGYNHSFRIIMKYPRHCSASGMFVFNDVPSFTELWRKSIYGFKQRVDNSLNKVVNTVANTSLLSSKLRKHWRTVLYILPVA